MSRWRRWAAVVAAVVVLATADATGSYVGGWFGPTAATLDESSVRQMARWAGVGPDAEIVYREDQDPTYINGYFAPGGFQCDPWGGCYERRVTIALIAGRDVPGPIVRYVLFHEIAHYLQWREWGENMFRRNIVELEWDADVRAVNLMCTLPDDGLGAIRAARDWLFEHYQYVGDLLHGTMADRVANALERAWECHQHHRRHSESP